MTCDNGPLRHKHHIIPRYKGGPDTQNNLVEVSITQHAMYHYCNYQLWGNEEDYVAWKALSGQINEQELLKEVLALGREAAKTPEAIKKKKQTLKQIKHQQGERNSQYGKMWITDGTKEGSYRINKGEPIPEGFRPGRVSIKEENKNRIFVITTPNGETIRTKNLTVYCYNNNIKYNHFLVVLKKGGTFKNYTGYIEYET